MAAVPEQIVVEMPEQIVVVVPEQVMVVVPTQQVVEVLEQWLGGWMAVGHLADGRVGDHRQRAHDATHQQHPRDAQVHLKPFHTAGNR